MATLHPKVIRLLNRGFTQIEDGLETIDNTGYVMGSVVSPDFAPLDDRARQDRLWKVLQEGLSPEELRHVGPIVTLSPAEAEIDVSLDR